MTSFRTTTCPCGGHNSESQRAIEVQLISQHPHAMMEQDSTTKYNDKAELESTRGWGDKEELEDE